MADKDIIITVHASLDFRHKMLAVRDFLEASGFKVILPELRRFQHIRDELGDDRRFTQIKASLTKQNMENVEKCDCLLILNYSHRGIKNYIGGNSFLEMVVASYLGKRIYLLNDIPTNMPYTEEIKALRPIVIGSLDELRDSLRGE